MVPQRWTAVRSLAWEIFYLREGDVLETHFWTFDGRSFFFRTACIRAARACDAAWEELDRESGS